nr:hypothetical protein [Nostoc sp. DedVER01b]
MEENPYVALVIGAVCLLFSGWNVVWWIRTIVFYARRDWDYSENFGPQMAPGEDTEITENNQLSGRAKIFYGIPFFIMVPGFIGWTFLAVAFKALK